MKASFSIYRDFDFGDNAKICRVPLWEFYRKHYLLHNRFLQVSKASCYVWSYYPEDLIGKYVLSYVYRSFMRQPIRLPPIYSWRCLNRLFECFYA